ncbi:MAG: hypothetical protein RLZZ200_3175 [Pseudomonadota bacterium]|jgi:cytochrome c
MNIRNTMGLAIGLLAATSAARAAEPVDAGAALAKASRCYSCHDTANMLIGPPYQAIAARYANDRRVMETVLARKILLGGGGNWGAVPMVPNEHVKPADALALARWVLDQQPK